MYKVPKKLKMPISMARLSLGIETEASFQDKLQRRLAIYCILTAFSGLAIGFTAEKLVGQALDRTVIEKPDVTGKRVAAR